MSINQIPGQLLQGNLERDGNSLAFVNTANSTPTLFLDIANSNVGINTATPQTALDIVGTLSVDTINAHTSSGNIAINTNANVSGNISATGNITGDFFFGNGSQLTGIAASSVNANNLIGNTLSSNVTTSSLTAVGTLASLSVTGNTTSGNLLTAGLISATGNAQAANITTAGLISAAGNVATGGFFIGDGSLISNINANVNTQTLYVDNIISYTSGANINVMPSGNGVFTIANTYGGATGIQLGSNTQGTFVSNATVLTSNTSVTNGLALLNQVLGKLVPTAPPNFPANTTLTITTSSTSARMCSGFTQPNNTTTGNKAVAAGTLVSAIRSSTYTTNTISNAGPGDSGTLRVYLNSVNAGNVTFNTAATPTGNGVYSNLVVTNNYDYHNANANVLAGFWYVFTSQATGTVPSGWNEVYMSDTQTGNTNTLGWYYDASTASAPVFSSKTFTACASPSLTYSSTIPHYNSGTNFLIGFSVNNLSGNMYPNNGNLLTNTTTAGGAFQAPATVSYSSAGITVPLAQNLYVGSGNANAATTAAIVTGFGSSASGPQITVTNSYNSTASTFTPSGTVLYKTGTSTAIDESNIVIGSTIGSGSGNAYRIVNPGTGNTPVFTGSEAQFNSITGPFYSYDATVVGSGSQGVLKFDQTNYASGSYLPAGPNLTAQGSSQWFTFKFVRTATSKFDIQIAGTVGGIWVALPGSVFDTNVGGIGPTSDLNGWLNMSLPYGGSGRPGASTANGGNGSNGCALSGVIPINTAINGRYTCTFGTVSSSSTSANEIYVRIRLTSGQSVTTLALQSASN